MANENDIGLDDMFGGATPETPNEDEGTGLEVAEREPSQPAHHTPMQSAPVQSAPLPPAYDDAPLPASEGEAIRALPPQPKKSALGRFLGLFVVAALAGGVAFILLDKKEAAPPPSEVVEEEARPTVAIDRKALRQKRPQNAPGCWQTNEGYRFAFVGGDGKRKLVDKVEEIPMLYRAGASCRKE